ncbi:hypothetical protein CERZMDRAFT_96967 [Cercospora zeae-maydis SCOH1-5]|uniref:Uncharacterized protein n=1 Tax=Cercospora zeae-maydis SCOH1-5 TaxID=717836 RepID=A0A6A6FJ99_9PEZI|nr:hypothetical protein CERZMDRAFT_96967 [Cercospora zeae-maydis SCOH1-5]
MSASHGAQPLTNRYCNRYSTTLTDSQHLRLAKDHSRPLCRRLSSGLGKLRCKARKLSSEFCKSLHAQQKPHEEQLLLDKESIAPFQHDDAPVVRLHLCSVSDCDHMFCLPAIPKDYDLAVGHGVEDDHASIDYNLESSRVEQQIESWQEGGDECEIIEPEDSEVNGDVFRGFSGAWPQDLPKNSSPLPPQMIWKEMKQHEQVCEQKKRNLGGESSQVQLIESSSSPCFLPGCGPDPEPTRWLYLPPEDLETAEWLVRLWHSFSEESDESGGVAL